VNIKFCCMVLCSALLVTACASKPTEKTTAITNGEVFDINYIGSVKTGVEAYNKKEYLRSLQEFYGPAEAKKNPIAQYYLGLMYAHGQGIGYDKGEAKRWLTQAATNGNVDAQYTLGDYLSKGIYIDKNPVEAVKWFQKAADGKHAVAQFTLANIYLRGSHGVKRDDRQALLLMKAAAEQRYAAAQNALGTYYQYGVGTSVDLALAEQHYKNAVAQGVIAAKYNLARLYLDGTGNLFDPINAHGLMEQAALAGHPSAIKEIALLNRQLDSIKNSITLFGVPLSIATREQLRLQVKREGGVSLKEQDDLWDDIYDSQDLLVGSDRLIIGYSLEKDRVASVQYRFPEANTPSNYHKIYQMIIDRYGRAVELNDNESGRLLNLWKFKNVTIKIEKGWPEKSLFLSYEVEGNYNDMLAEQERARAKDPGKAIAQKANTY